MFHSELQQVQIRSGCTEKKVSALTTLFTSIKVTLSFMSNFILYLSAPSSIVCPSIYPKTHSHSSRWLQPSRSVSRSWLCLSTQHFPQPFPIENPHQIPSQVQLSYQLMRSPSATALKPYRTLTTLSKQLPLVEEPKITPVPPRQPPPPQKRSAP